VDFSKRLYEIVRDYLRERLPDPINRGGHWIYPDYPREDAKMPRIGIVVYGTYTTEFGLGFRGQRVFSRVEVSVWTDSRKDGIVDGLRYRGSGLREALSDKIINILIGGRAELSRLYGIKDVRLVSTTVYAYNPDRDLYRKDLVFDFVWDTEKT